MNQNHQAGAGCSAHKPYQANGQNRLAKIAQDIKKELHRTFQDSVARVALSQQTFLPLMSHRVTGSIDRLFRTVANGQDSPVCSLQLGRGKPCREAVATAVYSCCVNRRDQHPPGLESLPSQQVGPAEGTRMLDAATSHRSKRLANCFLSQRTCYRVGSDYGPDLSAAEPDSLFGRNFSPVLRVAWQETRPTAYFKPCRNGTCAPVTSCCKNISAHSFHWIVSGVRHHSATKLKVLCPFRFPEPAILIHAFA